jgi:hypothetical protein
MLSASEFSCVWRCETTEISSGDCVSPGCVPGCVSPEGVSFDLASPDTVSWATPTPPHQSMANRQPAEARAPNRGLEVSCEPQARGWVECVTNSLSEMKECRAWSAHIVGYERGIRTARKIRRRLFRQDVGIESPELQCFQPETSSARAGHEPATCRGGYIEDGTSNRSERILDLLSRLGGAMARAGQVVEEGDFLAQIDARPYQASLLQAQATRRSRPPRRRSWLRKRSNYRCAGLLQSVALLKAVGGEWKLREGAP